jgi:hypothetical protein
MSMLPGLYYRRSMLAGFYYQESVAKTLLSRLYCEDSIILMMYGDESSRTSETIGDYYSKAQDSAARIVLSRLCSEESVMRTLLQ